MNTVFAITASIIIGTLYYFMMEKSIPKGSNCSFISSQWTDIFAFILGSIVVYKGHLYNDWGLVFMGCTIIVEHIWQYIPKVYTKKIF